MPLNYSIRVCLYKQEHAFGPGVAELMEQVEETESLSAACRRMKMAYSKGWKIVRRAEEELGMTLMEGKSGGNHGGGMVLTHEGKELLTNYRRFQKELRNQADQLFQDIFFSPSLSSDENNV